MNNVNDIFLQMQLAALIGQNYRRFWTGRCSNNDYGHLLKLSNLALYEPEDVRIIQEEDSVQITFKNEYPRENMNPSMIFRITGQRP